MNPIAITVGGTVLYWSSLILCLGVAAWFSLSCALYTTDGGSAVALWIFFPFAVFFSVLFSRLLHWYCSPEQYSGFLAAMTNYDSGGYCLPGVLLGTVLAAQLPKRLRFAGSTARLLDALAPGAALGIALIRFSALFGNSCRGKLVITRPLLQHLPLAAPVTSGSEILEYRFATFFAEALLLLLLTLWLLRFYFRRRRAPMRQGRAAGSTALMFLVFFSAVELVLDSTRYDSSFLRSNGFVSMVQIISAVSIFAVLLYYSCRSIRALGFRFVHLLLWLLWLLSLGAAGYLEYLVQRHGDWYLFCYGLMSLSCLLMALAPYGMYRTLRKN